MPSLHEFPLRTFQRHNGCTLAPVPSSGKPVPPDGNYIGSERHLSQYVGATADTPSSSTSARDPSASRISGIT